MTTLSHSDKIEFLLKPMYLKIKAAPK